MSLFEFEVSFLLSKIANNSLQIMKNSNHNCYFLVLKVRLRK